MVNLIKDIPTKLLSLLTKHNGIVAGGYFRSIVEGNKSKDMDIFFLERQDWINFNKDIHVINNEEYNAEIEATNFNLQRLKLGDLEIDSIHYFKVSRDHDVSSSFDYTINMLWLDPKDLDVKGNTVVDKTTIIKHIENRELHTGNAMWYTGTVTRTIIRLNKFIEAGYTIDKEELKKVNEAIQFLKVAKPVVNNNSNLKGEILK